MEIVTFLQIVGACLTSVSVGIWIGYHLGKKSGETTTKEFCCYPDTQKNKWLTVLLSYSHGKLQDVVCNHLEKKRRFLFFHQVICNLTGKKCKFYS